jgi:hypothetical protein
MDRPPLEMAERGKRRGTPAIVGYLTVFDQRRILPTVLMTSLGFV